MVYLSPENAKFYETGNGFPCLNAFIPPVKKDDLDTSLSDEPVWQDLGRVFFHRAFPYDSADTFISVTDKEGNEYGIIKNISDFDGNGKEIIEKELKENISPGNYENPLFKRKVRLFLLGNRNQPRKNVLRHARHLPEYR